MFDSIKASKNIKEEFIDYVSTTYQFSDDTLNRKFKEELDSDIAKGPYVEINSIYETCETLRELINTNPSLFSSRFFDLEKNKSNQVIPLDRKLYTHQKEAILKSVGGKNIIISTGTGSGKTLCFLIPVINDLLKEIDKNNGKAIPDGVRTIFIFPMNALANDQIKNIRTMLKDFPYISFGVYNGATDEHRQDAELHYETIETIDGKKIRDIPKNERICRDDMKAHPPNILFTNYAMLEYLLFRPDDDALFSNSDTRYIVLDEAHVYSGISGIETSFLISRLKARLSNGHTQFILTSATLGSSKEDIADFGHRLCGEDFITEDIIGAKRVDEEVVDSSLPLTSFRDILANPKYENMSEKDKSLREELYSLIPQTYEYRLLRDNYPGVHLLSDLEKGLGYSSDDMLRMLDLCTKARKNEKSLIDIKYHFFVRCLDGCYMSLYPKRELSLVAKKSTVIDGVSTSMFEIALCNDCGEIALIGKQKNGKLVYSKIYDENTECYCFASEYNDSIDFEDEESSEENIFGNHFFLCPQCGAISQGSNKKRICEHDINNYIDLIKVNPTHTKKFKCPHCHKGEFYRFFLGNDAATSVLATALYEELSSEKSEDLQQFLIFSDSRQEAAKFACYLGDFYNNEIIRRRAIYQTLEELTSQINDDLGLPMSNFASSLSNYFSNHNIYENKFECDKNAWVALMNEIVRSDASTSLSSLGLIRFQYSKIYTDPHYKNLYQKYCFNNGVSWEYFVELLNLLVNEIVNMDAIQLRSNSSLIGPEEKKYIFHHASQTCVCLYDDRERKNRSQWIPKNNGSSSSYFKAKRMYYVMETLGISSQAPAAKFLEDFFNIISEGRSELILNVEDFNVLPPSKIKLYECSACHKISQYSLNGMCTVSGCYGKVSPVDGDDVYKENHYAKLYKENVMQPLLVKEHTAQLSRRESASYQNQFRQKEINALSCSTTFEMGIDIGNLEAIFLRNVPPTPSNYSQRAGRAGRSVDSAAYILNYAKLSSHDLSFYSNPISMINGEIKAPYFKLNNEKIALRHVYAVAFSLFFRLNKASGYYGFADFIDSERGYTAFIDWLETKPEILKKELFKSIPNEEDLYEKLGLDNFGWCDDLYKNDDATLKRAIAEYQNNKKEFQSEIDKIIGNKHFYDIDDKTAATINDLRNRLERYTSKELIDFLARNNILPRHGFPIDTVELQQNYFTPYDRYKKQKDPYELQLSRDLKIAISEYAPSAEVVADGRLYTSRYISKPVQKSGLNKWHTSYIAKCPNEKCEAINYYLLKKDQKCSCCGEDIPKEYLEESIEPQDGFIAEANVKPVPMESLDKQYSTETAFIGKMNEDFNPVRKIKYGNHTLKISYASDQELMLRSISHFYTCDECGYSLSGDEGIKDSSNKKDAKRANQEMKDGLTEIDMGSIKHKNYFNGDCACNTLHRYYLHHVFKTDVVKIDFDGISTSEYEQMLSVMYAIYNSMADAMQIEKRELSCCLYSTIKDGIKYQSIIIFDNVPGGAGHTKRLFESDDATINQIIYEALMRVKYCDCDPSCYKCLRSYENRLHHDDLDRLQATSFLEEFISEEV